MIWRMQLIYRQKVATVNKTRLAISSVLSALRQSVVWSKHLSLLSIRLSSCTSTLSRIRQGCCLSRLSPIDSRSFLMTFTAKSSSTRQCWIRTLKTTTLTLWIREAMGPVLSLGLYSKGSSLEGWKTSLCQSLLGRCSISLLPRSSWCWSMIRISSTRSSRSAISATIRSERC